MFRRIQNKIGDEITKKRRKEKKKKKIRLKIAN